ncbi:MAG: tetratricopeptide repeat protein [Candidatus Nitrospinota bacterium M3_3B_026]
MAADTVKGVYYESKAIEAGTMATKRVSAQAHDIHYYCKSNPKGEVDLYYLKPDGTPTAIVMDTISMEEFSARFKDCSMHTCSLKPKTEDDKKKEKAENKVNEGERHLNKKEYYAAAFEFGQAVKMDGKNLKAHLGKGKAHLSLGEVDKARESFEKLSEIDSLYDKENKHLFNEYGIELRKGHMYDMAIENYDKAVSIDPDDEALYFNMGRAYHEKGDDAKAKKSLEKALSLKPDFKEARMLYDAIARKVTS